MGCYKFKKLRDPNLEKWIDTYAITNALMGRFNF